MGYTAALTPEPMNHNSVMPPDDFASEIETGSATEFGLDEQELAELAAEEAAQSGAIDDQQDQLLEEIERLKLERDDLKNQLLRSFADLQNFRKHSSQRLADTRREVAEAVLVSVLPVLDNFERTLKALATGATLESLNEGVTMVERQLRTVLESHELQRMRTIGQVFDPELHEAVETWDSPDHADGTITDEVVPGYQVGGKVVRPAQVRVARKANGS